MERLLPHMNGAAAAALAGMSASTLQRLIEMPRDELAAAIARALDGTTTAVRLPKFEESPLHAEARALMGENFLGIPEVLKTFGVITQAEVDELVHIPFSEHTLQHCKDTHLLIADVGSCIQELRKMRPNLLIRTGDTAWDKPFGKRNPRPSWLLIRKTRVPGSAYKTFEEQCRLLPALEDVPTARQLVYATMVTYVATGRVLCGHFQVPTSDFDEIYRVYVGATEDILFTTVYRGEDSGPRNPDIHLITMQKFDA
jgi:hypothetical protein